MYIDTRLSRVLLVVLVLGGPAVAHAHGMVGKRFFPATLATEDPFVADELSLPTVSTLKQRASGDEPATRETEISAELSKRITPDLGVSIAGSFLVLSPEGEKSVTGFENLELGLKYVFFTSPANETILSLGVDAAVGGTGSSRVGAESFSTLAPGLFFGQGFGFLPDSADWLKPLAVTGQFGVAVPIKQVTTTTTVNDAGEPEITKERNANTAVWGFSVQYNLQYLQSYVRDVGLPQPFSRMIPLVEFAMQTPINGADSGRTTGTINPGVIWFGRFVQVGMEAVVPVNARSGKGAGFLGQLHFYLDDIAPAVFSWTPFHGVLGPTQPR